MAKFQRQQILRQTKVLFLVRGFATTSLAHITEACACSKGAIYHHFPHKEAIGKAVLEQDRNALIERIHKTSERDPATYLSDLASTCASFGMHDGNYIGNALFCFSLEFRSGHSDLGASARAALEDLQSAVDKFPARISKSDILSELLGAHCMAYQIGHAQAFGDAARRLLRIVQ